MSSLHNYRHIKVAIPKEICDQICVSFIRDHMVHTTARLHAAGLLRSKKGKDLPDATPQHGEGLSAKQPVFDHVKKTRAKGKGKEKAPPIQPACQNCKRQLQGNSGKLRSYTTIGPRGRWHRTCVSRPCCQSSPDISEGWRCRVRSTRGKEMGARNGGNDKEESKGTVVRSEESEE